MHGAQRFRVTVLVAELQADTLAHVVRDLALQLPAAVTGAGDYKVDAVALGGAGEFQQRALKAALGLFVKVGVAVDGDDDRRQVAAVQLDVLAEAPALDPALPLPQELAQHDEEFI